MKDNLKSAQHKAKLSEEEVSTMRQALSEARETISR
jgi:5-bromo-4-chloroindolyl phosphate hydrolysis protein